GGVRLVQDPGDEGGDGWFTLAALAADDVVGDARRAEYVEQFHQATLGEIVGDVGAARQGDALIVYGRLHRHAGVGKARSLGQRLHFHSGVAKPVPPARTDVRAVPVEQGIAQQVLGLLRRLHALEKARR